MVLMLPEHGFNYEWILVGLLKNAISIRFQVIQETVVLCKIFDREVPSSALALSSFTFDRPRYGRSRICFPFSVFFFRIESLSNAFLTTSRLNTWGLFNRRRSGGGSKLFKRFATRQKVRFGNSIAKFWEKYDLVNNFILKWKL